jgi:4-carboxymuconolactone decarboxylase
MAQPAATGAILSELDDATRALVRLAAMLAGGSEEDVRAALQSAAKVASHQWIEELLLQTYLFAGFPRALNGMREWRRIERTPQSAVEPLPADAVRARGEKTCAAVYGGMYERLRRNIRDLHPALDDWMIVEGYGKVLGRTELDLQRRELCIAAACAATGQDRQLQSHLHGARNVGVSVRVIGEALDALRGAIPDTHSERAHGLWQRIRNDIH